MLNIILGESIPIINQHHRIHQGTIASACVANNNEPIPIAFIQQHCNKLDIQNTYSSANPNPRDMNVPDQENMFCLSAFLQHRSWPVCHQQQPCEKPTIVHQPDVAVVLREGQHLVPNNCNQYHVPILICEIEGSKDVWGQGEQQSKALEEACYSLAFILENYIIFVYPRCWEVICCTHNPHTGTIDVESEVVHLQQDGDVLMEKMKYICEVVIKIFVRQLTIGKRLIELVLPRYRQSGLDAINIFHPPKNVCHQCWNLVDIDEVTAFFNNNPNNLPQFE